MIRSVWTFPGQLTEYVGMGGGLLEGSAALAERLACASRLAGVDLARICREGPEETPQGRRPKGTRLRYAVATTAPRSGSSRRGRLRPRSSGGAATRPTA